MSAAARASLSAPHATTFLGDTMKRGAKRWRFVIAALALVSLSAAAQQAGAPGAASSAPQEQKNGTGVVPPGVKLAASMPGAGAPRAFHFPQAATKTLPNGLRVFVVTDHERAVHRRAHGDSHRGQHQRPRDNAGRGADDGKHADPGHAKEVRARDRRNDRFYRWDRWRRLPAKILRRSSSTS